MSSLQSAGTVPEHLCSRDPSSRPTRQVLENSLEARVLQSDNSALARDCRKEMKALNGRLLKLGAPPAVLGLEVPPWGAALGHA